MTSPDGDAAREDLQFDSAEPSSKDAAGLTCVACRNTLTGAYHMLNRAVLCARCREMLEAEWTGRSEAVRFGKALLFGLGGAAVGAGIYYAVLALTGMEIGLIAIVVGFLVGKAVHRGSGARGGWGYQTLAIVLTYFAIITTYVPLIIKGMTDQGAAVPMTAGRAIAVLLFAAMIPFLAGVKNVIGLLIIGFALFQAWKLNKRVPMVFSGPYQVGSSPNPA